MRRSLGHRWLAFDKSTGEFVGWFGLRLSDDMGEERELGYRLRRAAWGKGLATEGSLALIGVAFTRLGAQRVWADTIRPSTPHLGSHGTLRLALHAFRWSRPEPIEGTELGDVGTRSPRRSGKRARADADQLV